MAADPKIIYEDDDLLAIDKPAGLATHRDSFSADRAVTDWLVDYYPPAARVGEPARPGIVHRLDKATSGVLLTAKNQAVYLFLKNEFRLGRVQKIYRAIVCGVVKRDEGVIDLPIGRSNRDPRRRVASAKAAGRLRPAVTGWRVLERFVKHTLLEVKPQTGRTHQIRVHLKAIGYPILGDKLYAPNQLSWSMMPRQALHALSLEFNRPAGERLKVVADPPADFRAILDFLRQR